MKFHSNIENYQRIIQEKYSLDEYVRVHISAGLTKKEALRIRRMAILRLNLYERANIVQNDY